MDRTVYLKDYANYLRQEDYSEHTISKYVRDIRRFLERNGDDGIWENEGAPSSDPKGAVCA